MNARVRQQSGRRRAWSPLLLLLVFILAALVLLTLLYFNAAARVFQLLGLTPLGSILLLGASLVGSMINIPLTRRRMLVENPVLSVLPAWVRQFAPLFYYYPPVVVEQVVALNVGGAIIPLAFSVYLFTLPTTPWLAALVATAIMATVAKLLARPMPGQGIALPVFVPPLVAALSAHFLTPALGGTVAQAAPVAYIAGTLGTLLGADILNLPRVLRGSLYPGEAAPLTREEAEFEEELEATEEALGGGRSLEERRNMRYVVSIGGAGVFDGIFVTSVLAPLLAVL